jgi:hypothetical protein
VDFLALFDRHEGEVQRNRAIWRADHSCSSAIRIDGIGPAGRDPIAVQRRAILYCVLHPSQIALAIEMSHADGAELRFRWKPGNTKEHAFGGESVVTLKGSIRTFCVLVVGPRCGGSQQHTTDDQNGSGDDSAANPCA